VPLLLAGLWLSQRDTDLLRRGQLTTGSVFTRSACSIKRGKGHVPGQLFVLSVDDGFRLRQFVLRLADSTVAVSAATLGEQDTAPMIVRDEQRTALVLLAGQPFFAYEQSH
jgi:hypothetical protein